MQVDFETLRGILEHRLHQADIERLLLPLSDTERAQLFLRITELVRRTSALVDIANRVSDTLSLDILFPRLMQVVTETLNVERSSLFLHDRDTGELFSRVMQGSSMGDIRFPADAGIAGSVFTSGQSEIIADAYVDPRFNQDVDRKTGFHTRNILCVPIRNRRGEVIGVTQALNKRDSAFDIEDQRLLETLSLQTAAALENAQIYEKLERAQREEAMLLDVVSSIASEIFLDPLLEKIVTAATRLLDADRGSLFLFDKATDNLYSRVAGGMGENSIRFPATAGLAGECFTSGAPVNIPDAYSDARFNPQVDRDTGYHTRNILCMPVTAKSGTKVGVMQILNKRTGPFSPADERRLLALCAQAAMSIENAQLFESIQNERNYNEAILRSMSNAVFTLDTTGRINKVNASAVQVLGVAADELAGRAVDEVFTGSNAWVSRSLAKVRESGRTDNIVDTDILLPHGKAVSVNLTTVPLVSVNDESLGFMLVMEDITREKRLRNTMSRYMSKAVVDQLLESGEQVLGGTGREVSVLFSDIRGFTTITERLGARETVSMLNEYFTHMVEVVFEHNGILDKYIGDMIMAVFGSVISRSDDAENAVRVGARMMTALRNLNMKRISDAREPIRIGVGISTGDVVAGNIGSPKRLEYTVIGDRVNLAERLQEANKYYGTDILMCDTTYERVKSHTLVREVDLIRVRGRKTPVAIYESLAHHDESTMPRANMILEAFAEGIRSFRARDWYNAERRFREVLALRPDDGPAQLYARRCAACRIRPPDEDWDGVWAMDK